MIATEPTMTDPTRPATKRWTWVEWLVLLLILVGAATLRFIYAPPDLSYDELWHLGLSTGRGSPLGQIPHEVVLPQVPRQTSLEGAPAAWHIWNGMDGVLHPPMYVLMLRFWRDLFGQSDTEARTLSVAWSCVTIIMQYAMMRDATNRRLATLVALTIAGAQAQVYFGQQVRGYSMLVGIGAIGLWLMTRIELHGSTRRRAISLGLIPFALVITHYFGAGAALAIAAFGIWRIRGADRRVFLTTIVLSGVVYCIAWVPFGIRQIGALATGDDFLHTSQPHAWKELFLLLSAPIRLVVDRLYFEAPANFASGIALVLPWLLTRRFPALRPWAIWLCLTFVPLTVLDMARSTEHMMFMRYLAAASPAVVPIFVGCAWAFDRRLAYAMGAALACMGLIFTLSRMPVSANSPGYASSTHYMAQLIQPDEGLVIANGDLPDWIADVFALHASHEPNLCARPFVILSGPMTPQIRAQLPRRVWVMTGDQHESIEQLVSGAAVLQRAHRDLTIGVYHLDLTGGQPPATTAVSPTSDASAVEAPRSAAATPSP